MGEYKLKLVLTQFHRHVTINGDDDGTEVMVVKTFIGLNHSPGEGHAYPNIVTLRHDLNIVAMYVANLVRSGPQGAGAITIGDNRIPVVDFIHVSVGGVNCDLMIMAENDGIMFSREPDYRGIETLSQGAQEMLKDKLSWGGNKPQTQHGLLGSRQVLKFENVVEDGSHMSYASRDMSRIINEGLSKAYSRSLMILASDESEDFKIMQILGERDIDDGSYNPTESMNTIINLPDAGFDDDDLPNFVLGISPDHRFYQLSLTEFIEQVL
jgi:hypothetical protein